MNSRTRFEAVARALAIEHYGYKEGDALLKSICEQRSNGIYMTEWVQGAWLVWDMQQREPDTLQAEPVTSNPVVQGLLSVAEASYQALDSTKDNGEHLTWDRAAFDRLNAAMDGLERLPDWKQFPAT